MNSLSYEIHEFVLELFFIGTLLWLYLSLSVGLYEYGTGDWLLKRRTWKEHNERMLNISIVGTVMITTYRNGGVAWLMVLMVLSLTFTIFLMMCIYIKKRWLHCQEM